MAQITVSKWFTFEASHVLPKHPGKCARLHGHSWRLKVSVTGPVNPETGFVVDYGELGRLVHEHVIDKLDHTHLGQYNMTYTGIEKFNISPPSPPAGTWQCPFGETFYPSSENLVIAIADTLTHVLPCHLSEVTLCETCTSEATWRP